VSPQRAKHRVGELRPSQILLTFGVGSVVDLPSLSVMVMGLNDWNPGYSLEVNEPRLLAAVRRQVGDQLIRLLTPRLPPRTRFRPDRLTRALSSASLSRRFRAGWSAPRVASWHPSGRDSSRCGPTPIARIELDTFTRTVRGRRSRRP